MDRVKVIKSEEEYRQAMQAAGADQLVVVDFTASWCGPCKLIAPVFAKLSGEFTGVQFLKVDVDQVQSVARQENVTAMPTFKAYKGGRVLGTVQGADANGLRQLIARFAGAEGTDTSGAASNGNKPVDITSLVDIPQTECLNQHEEHGVRFLFVGANYLESDVDAQLIITIPFKQAVKLHSLKFKAVSNKRSQAPKRVRVYANVLNLGFNDVDNVQETQVLTLTEADYAEDAVVPLRFVKFQSINQVTLFVESNQSEDDDTPTALARLELMGTPMDTTRMEQLTASNNNAGGDEQ